MSATCRVAGCYCEELDRGLCYAHAKRALGEEFGRTLLLFFVIYLGGTFLVLAALAILLRAT